MKTRALICEALTFLLATCTLYSAGRQEDGHHSSTSKGHRAIQQSFDPSTQARNGGQEDKLELLDICLVASVDGKFRAYNRSSGSILWSMSWNASSSFSSPALDPLVTTLSVPDYPHHLQNLSDAYLIEPQSGDMYILSNPESPLQRFPYTIPQLVDMSPFEFVDNNGNRTLFIGSKEASLLVIDLETGQLNNVINLSHPWNPFVDQCVIELQVDPESDQTKPTLENLSSFEVLIRRTDYHVTVYTEMHLSQDPGLPLQELLFSTYGPDSKDFAIQEGYRRTLDGIYVQATPNRDIIAFKMLAENERKRSLLLWADAVQDESKENVAMAFDVFRRPGRQSSLALAQPQMRLQDFDLLNLETGPGMRRVYIGIIGENKALYALSSEHYPLVYFANDNNLIFYEDESGFVQRPKKTWSKTDT